MATINNCDDEHICTCEYNSGCYAVVQKPKYFKFKVGSQICVPDMSGNCDSGGDYSYISAVIQQWKSTDTTYPTGEPTQITWEFNVNLNFEPGKYRIYVSAYHPHNGWCESIYATFTSFSFKGQTWNSSNTQLSCANGGAQLYIDYDLEAGVHRVDYLNGFQCRCSTSKPWGGTIQN